MNTTEGTELTADVSVTLIVVTYNSSALLGEFFASLPPALSGVESYKVVVSDNASRDNSVRIARQLCPEAIVVTSSENRGYAAAINAAVAASGPAEHILVLNDDIRLGANSVRTLISALGMDDTAGIAVPRLVDGNGRLLFSQRREPTVGRAFGEAVLGGDRAGKVAWLGGVVQNEESYRAPAHPTWASGCAWLIGRSCWDSVGEWDESFFLYSEDVDYALRAHDAGFAIRFVPTAQAVHLVGPSHRDPRLWAMGMWNRYRLYRRRHGIVQSQLFRLGLLLNEALRAAVGRKTHRAGALALISRKHRPPEVRERFASTSKSSLDR